jgi:tetratricopeptide (TPR) repeat protein
MFRPVSVLSLACVVGLLPAVLAGQPAAVWRVAMPTSVSGQAHTHFLEGVTSMHLHMFEDAEEHFRAAQRLSPGFAMAYWGEALNQHRTIWSYHNAEKARAVLQRLGPTPDARAAKAPTAREKAYLAAVETLFGSGAQADREVAYSEAMRTLSAAYPDDVEALAWYALSLMRVNAPGLTRAQTAALMASTSLRVLQRNPRHPGANRYLIQSTDDPVHSAIGFVAVDNLREVNPTAAEAIHIPSHVFVQHGMWVEAADANTRAFEASMAWTRAHNFKLSDLNNHNYGHLLMFANYALLQSGQVKRAEAIRQRVTADYEASGKALELRRGYADVSARRVIELAEWGSVEGLAARARQEQLDDQALWTAIGIGAARLKNVPLAREALEKVSRAEGGAASLPAREVSGLLLMAEGQTARGLETLEEAAAIDARNLTRIGTPPSPIKPAMELYGEVLLEQGKPAEALRQFEIGLTIFRRRAALLLGAARANDRLGRPADASRYYRELQDVWKLADSDHPWAREVRGKT